ncbi:flagellar basal body-associated protein FliL [Trinickia terrae]|uniref:Flagellar protein FliL n=1 Tax=Trinickia terrae TaxID=2571161 RepID=A0A4U1I7H8_9BURK|nr:flagellar basal body-associated protein FliL [Trinickia terrae]TKC89277.1 flagellar basal body-associated protein FliL [Trinickia terrae]
MATTTAAPQQQTAPAAKGKVKRIIVIATIIVIAALGAAAGTYFFLLKDGLPHSEAKPAPPPAPIFFALEPMTVNLQSDDGNMHYLRVGLSLKLIDPKVQEQLTQHMPEIRSRILLALSNKKPDDLATLDGKRALAAELKALVEKPTDAGGTPAHVQDVLFTEFVVQ